MNKAKTASIADYLLSRQPVSIQRRLERDESFLHRMGLEFEFMLGLEGRGLPLKRLLSAAREVLAEGAEQEVAVVDGTTFLLRRGDSGLELIVSRDDPAREPVSIRFAELALLSQQADERIVALDQVRRRLTPFSEVNVTLRERVGERPLSDAEMTSVLTDLSSAPQAVQEKLEARLRSGQAVIADLTPRDMAYFEEFCGPNPGDSNPEEYLRSTLPVVRQALLSRDLRKGLRVCLLGALRDDLCPGAWVRDSEDQELWDALSWCKPEREVFSLLGALDVALYRQHDERFRAFASEAIRRLAGNRFRRPDDVDLYELLPALCDFFLNSINSLEGGASRMSTWKRMCAWMQASLVARLTHPFPLELAQLEAALVHGHQMAAQYANILDLAREPMYMAAESRRSILRAEVVGRLFQIQDRHSREGRYVPEEDVIRSAVSRLDDASPPLSWSMPGPLEGHRRPAAVNSPAPAELPELFSQMIENGSFAAFLAYMSQLYSIGEEGKIALLGWLTDGSRKTEDFMARLAELGYAGLLAAAERDQKVAGVVADSVCAIAPTLQGEAAVASGLRALLFASAAFEEGTPRVEWLERELSIYAAQLPFGAAAVALLAHLREVEKVVGFGESFVRRAKAVVTAGH